MNHLINIDQANSNALHLKKAIVSKLTYSIGKDPAFATPQEWLQATELAVRDQLIERWMKTNQAQHVQNPRRVYYLSMEFLIGRTCTNAMLALGIEAEIRSALEALKVDYDELVNFEPDAALGNGGLGRLAACFLDSMATLGISGIGYGIRYDYGMFRQQIVDGNQVETPDYWLTNGNPWEFPRPEVQYRVRYGGYTEQHGDKVCWNGTEDVLAMAYDTIIPGYATDRTNTLRLWSARATTEIDLSAFNQGNYFGAVERKNHSENVSRVLYPDDSTQSGRELRLRQEYFFVSASMQDLIHRHLSLHSGFDRLAESAAVHLNDTHPVLAVPELLRILMDEHGVPWKNAWAIAQQIFSYTNHTLMHEALETWPVDMLGRVLPRHLQIIFDINSEFLHSVTAQFGKDINLMRRLSLIDEQGERKVRMAYLAVVASHKVNGVSKLHSELMKQSIFADFAKVYPERFTNKTNGVTPRRWLAQANPALAGLIDARIGPQWRADLDKLAELRKLADDRDFISAVRNAKRSNKLRLTEWVANRLSIVLNPDSLFDIQVKRIHEYKRQLMNLLHVITRYHRILANPDGDWVPRTVIFAGKAASAYHTAKSIIKLINDVATTINADPRVGERLKVVFIPNYSVSLAEIIIPAADLSEQISLAGTEASGTGNMKFALNGALTIGTLDGANIEILEQVGQDNIFIFGNTAAQVQDIRVHGYQPRQVYESNPELKQVLDQIRNGHFSPEAPDRFHSIFDTLVNYGDHYLLLADYASYVQTQDTVDVLFRDHEQWHRKAIHNIAGMGQFSSDRTIAEYAQEIWRSEPLK
ncbi:glycogen/starch/alpha-glucan phosphorylase [Noviherbaspirillum sp. Root189]|uniref:glycogen/starch/alpha-glucan phosphorylase n=1 Tax=Noviherbaspirillum sp. Root189 TaxID=1736487 RepID=UPI00070EB2C5|nr:glycogen/starch/alpha-glucan phosphorylase [Noviherbaspirillum sp. Root189]KRB67929.1 maltodextrin phosphorylase [Noviherbaspirillum sp. Root189]